jgi:hypothetical protein
MRDAYRIFRTISNNSMSRIHNIQAFWWLQNVTVGWRVAPNKNK